MPTCSSCLSLALLTLHTTQRAAEDTWLLYRDRCVFTCRSEVLPWPVTCEHAQQHDCSVLPAWDFFQGLFVPLGDMCWNQACLEPA
jgi:hypothetical protein